MAVGEVATNHGGDLSLTRMSWYLRSFPIGRMLRLDFGILRFEGNAFGHKGIGPLYHTLGSAAVGL
jgi:hypothetical protein